VLWFTKPTIIITNFRIIGFQDFVHRQEYLNIIKHIVSETESVSVLRRAEGGTYSLESIKKS
jgi:hypothetical protein